MALDPADTHYLYGGKEAPVAHAMRFSIWRRLFGFRATWGLTLGFFGNIYISWLFVTRLPGYLEIQRRMSIAKTGLVASVPFLFGMVGSLVFGWLADRLIRHGMTAIASRKLLTVIGLLLSAAATIGAAEAGTGFASVLWISAVLFLVSVARVRRGRSRMLRRRKAIPPPLVRSWISAGSLAAPLPPS